MSLMNRGAVGRPLFRAHTDRPSTPLAGYTLAEISMMFRPVTKNPRLFGIVVVVGIACGGRTGGDGGSATSVYGRYLAEVAENTDMLCDCYVELGYDSRDECPGEVGGSTGDEELDACIAEVFETNPLVDENLECETAALVDLNACVSDLSCGEIGEQGDAFDACFSTWLDAHEACPLVPGEVWDEVGVCRGRVCGDGTTIEDEQVCDGVPDCADETDEANCGGNDG